MANKRKTTTAIVAGVAAVALLLGGTFAWTSISQMAKNEATGVVNVGGRLHDDFNGKNKDVYVENFTDPYNGGQPIYARIKLTEYMEVGSEAGKLNDDGTAYDPGRKATSVIDGATIDDLESWSIHKPASDCAVCEENGTPCVFHSHWEWEMGGKTTFMPTFNKDKDSLEADINGTYHGTDATDKIYYDDYTEYTTDETDTTKTYSETGTAYYDNDPDMAKNEVDGQYTTKEETHYAKETVNATVITMQEWKETYNSAPGNYWVYDTDGWAYWANPIMPGEATGLLLSNIDMFKNPGEKCYYSINVVGQFATVGDWEQFGVNEEDEDYPSTDAIALLTKASESVPTVTVTNVTGDTLVNRGDEVTFYATTAIGAAATAADGEYEWVVLNEDREVITSSTIEVNAEGNAILTVGPEELSEGLYVAARDTTTGAVGLSAVAVQHYTVNITAENNTTALKAGKTLQLYAEVIDNSTGDPENSGVTWTVTGGNGNSTVSDDGVLSIDPDEAGLTTLTITATTKATGGFFATYTVTVADKYAVTVSQADNATVVFHGEPLQFTADVTKNDAAEDSGVTWTVSGGSGTTSISENGLLTIDDNETQATTLTVTATSKADDEIKATYPVTVAYKYDVLGPDIAIEADSFGTNQVLPPKAYLNETEVTDVVWTITGNTDSDTRIENGYLYLSENETAAEITLNARNANGKGSQTLSLRYKMKVVLFWDDDFSDVQDTIQDGDNRDSSPWGSNWTYQIRVCRENGAIIDGATMTITNNNNGNVTHGFIEAGSEGDSVKDGHDYWWAWTARDNVGNITINVTYGKSTFEATIW